MSGGGDAERFAAMWLALTAAAARMAAKPSAARWATVRRQLLAAAEAQAGGDCADMSGWPRWDAQGHMGTYPNIGFRSGDTAQMEATVPPVPV
jgi:hypothetical protein